MNNSYYRIKREKCCGVCGEKFQVHSYKGRIGDYCSNACKQKAYRRRKAEAKRNVLRNDGGLSLEPGQAGVVVK